MKPTRPLPTRYKNNNPSVLLMPSPADELSDFLNTTLLDKSKGFNMDNEDGDDSYSQNKDENGDCSSTISDSNKKPKASPSLPHTLLPPEIQHLSSLVGQSQHTQEVSNTQQTTTIPTTEALQSHHEHSPEDKSGDGNESNIATTVMLTPSCSNNQTELHLELVTLCSALKVADAQLASANKQVSQLKLKNKENSEELFKLKTSAKEAARQIKLYLLRQSNRKDRKQSDVVAKFFMCLLNNKEGEFPEDLMEAIKDNLCFITQKLIRTRLLTKDACLQVMDLEGHKVSLQVFDILRRLETGDRQYDQNSCLPSSGDIQKAQCIVDKYAQTRVAMKHGQFKGGASKEEFIKFDSDGLLTGMVKAFGLSAVAKTRAVCINLSIK